MPFQWSTRTLAPGATADAAAEGSSLIMGSDSTLVASAAARCSSFALASASRRALSSANRAFSSATDLSNAARAAS